MVSSEVLNVAIRPKVTQNDIDEFSGDLQMELKIMVVQHFRRAYKVPTNILTEVAREAVLAIVTRADLEIVPEPTGTA